MIQFILTDKAKELQEKGIDITPTRGTPRSAGLDLAACIDAPIVISAGTITKISLGVKIYLGSIINDIGYQPVSLTFMGMLLPRSSNSEMILTNTVGICDEDYQGEIFAKVTARLGAFTINPGDRIAQYVIVPGYINDLLEVESFSNVTYRGENGDGSTGGNYVHK